MILQTKKKLLLSAIIITCVGLLAGLTISNLNEKSVKQISAGGWHTAALMNNGTIRGWGDNGSGQLGDGTTTNRLVP